jgi:uncharacterized membrane protein YkoI
MRLTIVMMLAALVPATGAAAARPPHARITMARARAIALKAAPGKVVDAEYEKEAGAWRYSFDIRQGKRIHEIGVSAMTGKIVEDKFEGVKDKD